MLRAAKAANTAQIDFLVSALDEHLGGLSGRVIAMLGTAFKAGTDDVRESPAIIAGRRLVEEGAEVRVHDPIALDNTAQVAPELKPVSTVSMLTTGVDAVILSADWPEYGEIDWTQVSQSMRGDFVFDARNALDPEIVRSAGLRYAAYGRHLGSN